MNKSSNLYFNRINSITGMEGTLFGISPKGDVNDVAIAVYRDVPEPGEITSFSFGLSNRNRPEWIHARPELMISVKSTDDSWGRCMGEIIYQLDNKDRFAFGTIFNFKEQVCAESEMTSFFMFTNSLLLGDDAKIELPDRKILIAQLYPIYESEGNIISEVGAEHFFFKMGIDFTDVRRNPIQLATGGE